MADSADTKTTGTEHEPPRVVRLSDVLPGLKLDLADGRRLGVPLAYFPRLLNATPDQRKTYILSGGGSGIHWDDLDEDISVEGLLLGVGDRTH